MKTEIIAHRGASRIAPENTMPAFELAYDMGAEGIEVDVQLTKDNVPVLIHDENVKRTTNGRGFIKDMTWDTVTSLDAGAWFSRTYTGTQIVSLEEFLRWAKNKQLTLNIELKNNKIDYKHIENIVYEMLAHYQLLANSTISTFNPNSVERMKQFQHKVGVALLASRKCGNLVKTAASIGANALHVKYRLLNQNLVKACHAKGMPLRVYTINSTRRMHAAFKAEADGIFTDVPDKAIAFRKVYNKHK
ncbi:MULTISPECIES: glycerophosphodiester phosphodiesterase family protein [unclassified Virgibacillus]|uniref:glycerophosphodiester phosphodiesterase n=1 Tax=unclassified Virgibacillus TaxID=2620237 RepID=UPI0024DE04E7|nr:glycerophosphodiester phosphodiesterase family protein [Virgibacillus sp. LDC-1]